MIRLRLNWQAGVAAAGSILVLMGGCGGSADSTSSARLQDRGTGHPAPVNHASPADSAKNSPDGRERPSSPSRNGPGRGSHEGKAQRAPSRQAPAERAGDAVAEVRDLVGGGGGGKQRVARTPKQIRKVLREVNDDSSDQPAGTPGPSDEGSQSGGGGSQTGVEESLEKILP
jgi:hypothetical protein